MKISNDHPNEEISGKIVQLLIDNSGDSYDNNVTMLDKVINNPSVDITTIVGLTGYFFISSDNRVFSLGTTSNGELGYKGGNYHSPERNTVIETIISRTLANSNRGCALVPTIVCGYSHTILYFSDVRSRNYLLFVGNLENHSHNYSHLCDISFVF